MEFCLANSTFNYTDAFDLDSQLTDEELSLKEMAHKYCQEKLMPRVLKMYREEGWDATIFPELGKMGLLGSPYKVFHFLCY